MSFVDTGVDDWVTPPEIGQAPSSGVRTAAAEVDDWTVPAEAPAAAPSMFAPITERAASAGGSFAQGAAGVVASLPKQVAVVEGQRRYQIAQTLDAVDNGTYRFTNADAHVGVAREYAAAATPEERAAIRARVVENPDPRSMAPYQAGEAIETAVKEAVPTDPRYQDEWIAGKIPQGLGSATGFLAAGIAGRAIGLPGLLTASGTGAASQSVEQFEDATKHGASLTDAFNAANYGAVVGTSEGVPIAHLLERLDKGTGGTVKRTFIDMLKQGTEEAIQEAFQNIASNLIANGIVAYDPERGTFTGTGEAAGVGFTVGALMQFLGGIVTGGRRRGSAGAQPGAEQPGIPPSAPSADPTLPPDGTAAAPDQGMVVTTIPSGAPPPTPTPTPSIGEVDQSGLPAGAVPADMVLPAAELDDWVTEPPGRDASGRDALKQLLDDPRPVAEIRAEAEAQAAIDAPAVMSLPDALLSNHVIKAFDAQFEDGQRVPGLGLRLDHGDALEHAGLTGKDGLLTYPGLQALKGEAARRAAIPPTPGSREAPVRLETPADVSLGAEQTAQPTPREAKAGNFRKRHLKWETLDISIETEAGADRVAPDGSWRATMPVPYGQILGTIGADGDPLDISIGPNPKAPNAYIIDQRDPDTLKFDEHKTFQGFDSANDAQDAYDKSFSDGSGPFRAGAITEMPVPQFLAWVANGNHKKALAYEAPVQRRPAKLGPLSLFQFLAQRGGIKDFSGELRSMGLTNVFIPGFGRLVRANGLDLDHARETIVEAGYLREPGNLGGVAQTTINHLLELLDTESRGNKVYSDQDREAVAERKRNSDAKELEARVKEVEQEVRETAQANGITALSVQELREARDLVLNGEDTVVIVDIVERNAIAFESERSEIEAQRVRHEQQTANDAAPAAPARSQAAQAVEQRQEPVARPAEGSAAPGVQPGERQPRAGAGLAAAEQAQPATERTDESAGRPAGSVAGPRESPIAQFRRDAQAIHRSLPPVAENHTRLWRGNRPGEVGQNPSFTNSLAGIALPFKKAYGGELSYVDVPTSDLAKYENKAGAASGAEFTLPREIASTAKVVPQTERTDAGQQHVLPGAGPISGAEQAQRKADSPLKPKVAQKPADAGLFGDDSKQTDLVDLARKPEPTRQELRKHQRAFPSYTIDELKKAVASPNSSEELKAKMRAEIAARESGASKVSVTPQIVPAKAPAKPDAPANNIPANNIPAGTQAPEAGPSDSKDYNTVALARVFARDLADGKAITTAYMQHKAAEAYGGKLSEGKFDRKDMFDALELAINMRVKEDVDLRIVNGGWQRAAQQLGKMLAGLPTQTVRSEEQQSFQQFSTPPNYALAVAYAANLRDGDVVLEPSAGTGSLVAAATHPGVEVIANELSDRRAAMLRELIGKDGKVFSEDAEQIDNILPDTVKPTVVMMNPPFSQTAGRMGNQKVPMTGANHVEAALNRLEPGGRLVAIVGQGMTMGQPTFRDWWKKIGAEYAVRANIGVSGEVYKKYGTTFGTRLIVIDKVAPDGQNTILADVQTVEDLMRTLGEIRDGRPVGEKQPAQSSREPVPAASEGGRAGALPADTKPGGVGPGERGNRGVAGARPAGPGKPSGNDVHVAGQERADVAPVQPERGGAGGAGAKSLQRPADGGRSEAGRGDAAKRDLQPAAKPEPGAPASSERSELETVAPGTQNATAEISESLYEEYEPQRVRVKGAKPHPGPLVQSAAMASVWPPAVTYQPSLPKAVIEEGKLSNAQIEAVVYAGQAHAKMLPVAEGETERRRGFFIGDGTGVGKGREIAGIILDNWQQGRKKAVWISEKKTLVNDARRDWTGLGQQGSVVFDASKAKTGEPIKAERGIAFMTYDTLKGGMSDQAAIARGGFVRGESVKIVDPSRTDFNKTAKIAGKLISKNKSNYYPIHFEDGSKSEALAGHLERTGAAAALKSRVDQLVDWFGKDFDGVIAFDESHNMGNASPSAGERGVKDAAQKALAGMALQARLPKARIVYVSATGATEVSNLAYADRLGLWGRGTPFASQAKFVAEVESGGIAAMELIARDMKQLGLYTARNLSYDGVEYESVVHKLDANQREIYDSLAEAWQVVLRNINAALEETGAKQDGRAKSAAYSAFWGGHQRFFNQIITSLQMPSVIKAVEKDLAAGRQAVLQLTNTNEASQERAAAKAKTAEEIEDLDITPRDQIIQLVETSFPTQEYEQFLDGDKVRSRPVVDAEGNPVQNKKALAMREALIDRLASVRVPQGPLDMLLDHFGTENVAEVTGRGRRFVLKPDEKTGERKRTEESRPGSSNVAEADAFQDGKKKILVFSDAGGTGRSYHADNTSASKGARRAHYLLQGGWRADRAVQGFGRTHRTNQASAPIFSLVTTDLQGQKRFISSIARRLAQLGALTKGQRQAGDQGMFSARDNLESTEAHVALRQFYMDLLAGRLDGISLAQFEEQTGLALRNELGQVKTEFPPITQFLNRLLSLKIDMQNRVFNAFSDKLDAVIEARQQAGLLDVGLETVRADKIAKDSERTVYTVEESGAETKHVKLTLSDKFHPKAFNEVANSVARPVQFWVKSPNGKVYAVVDGPSITDEAGKIVDNYRIISPVSESRVIKRETINGKDAKWEQIKKPAAEELWHKEIDSAPEFISRDMHLITGAILPIWDRLGGSTRVVRLQTDSGERLIGRVVGNSRIAETLKKLGAEAEATKIDPAQLFDRLMAGGRAKLANDWTLSRRMVAGEHRIELRGPSAFSEGQEVKADGVFTERIAYELRYFVPTDAVEGKKVLAALTKFRPVVEASEGKGEVLESVERPRDAGRLTPKARQRQADLERMMSDVVSRLAGKDVQVNFEAGRHFENDGAPPIGYPESFAKAHARARYYTSSRIIEVALGADDVVFALLHEIWHDIEFHLLKDSEIALLKRETERLRPLLVSEFGWTQAEAAAAAGYEVRAMAFEIYARNREQGRPLMMHTGVARIFARVLHFLRQLRNGLHGLGFKTAEDIYGQGFEGKFATRPDLGTRRTETLASIAGPKAKTADLKALARAEEMTERGAKPLQIWRQTGWFKGVDDKWRFEIPDRSAQMVRTGRGPDIVLMRELMAHPELYKAYPALANMPVGKKPGSGWGGQYKTQDTGFDIAPSERGNTSTTLHETQHYIQDVEGFAQGGSFTHRTRVSREQEREYRKIKPEHERLQQKLIFEYDATRAGGDINNLPESQRMSDAEFTRYQELDTIYHNYWRAKGALRTSAEENYMRLAGEVESRNVQARRDFDEAYRLATPPWETEDRQRDQQLVNFVGTEQGPEGFGKRAGEVLSSIVNPNTPAPQRSRAMQGFIARGQPLDRAMRIPFDIFGGTTADGQWKPGMALSNTSAKIIVGAKFSPQGRFAFLNPLMETVRSGLVDRYNLREMPEYVDRERARALDERAVMLQGAEVLKTLKDHAVGPAEAKVLQAILTGEPVNDAAMAGLAAPIREAIDQLGQEAVALGLVSPESFERNRGAYLHRVYQKHEADQNGLSRMVNQIMTSRRKRIIGDQFKGRGIFHEVALPRLMRDVPDWHEGARGKPQNGEKFIRLDEMSGQNELALPGEEPPEKVVRTVWWPADRPVPDRYSGFKQQGAWELRGEKGGKLVIWRDFTKAERVKMGEILDARYTIGKTFMLMAHDLATGRFYKDIAENEDWASKMQPEGRVIEASEWQRGLNAYKAKAYDWVKVPNVAIPDSGGKKRYAGLSGMWVREEIWRDLHEVEVMTRPNSFAMFWRALLTQWKLNKTARSPVVHMNNVMSNFVLMDMMDVRMQDLVAGVLSYAKGDQHFQEAFENGAFGADMISKEIRENTLKPILEELARTMTAPPGRLGALGQVSKFTEFLWSKAKQFDRGMRWAYQIEDELFRMATYIRRRELGDDPKQAATVAREQFIDYDIRAPWVRAARNTVLPFISYTYRSVPLIAKAVATRPWKIAKYAMLAYVANALAYAASGGDEDKERRSLNEREQGRSWLGGHKMTRMPFNDKHGNPIFLDVKRWVPAGDIFDMQDGDMPAWLNLGGPLMIGAELMLNRAAFTGREIVNSKTDDIWDRMSKRGDHLYKSWVPSAAYVPGSWYWERVANAMKGAMDRQGRPYDVGMALASSVGVKLKPQDVQDAMAQKGAEFGRIERELMEEANRIASRHQRGFISESEFNRAMADILKKMERLAKKATDTFKD